jgi:hypothetical protein
VNCSALTILLRLLVKSTGGRFLSGGRANPDADTSSEDCLESANPRASHGSPCTATASFHLSYMPGSTSTRQRTTARR